MKHAGKASIFVGGSTAARRKTCDFAVDRVRLGLHLAPVRRTAERVVFMSVVDAGIVEVDRAACARVAQWLAAQQIPADAEETTLPGLSEVEIGDFYLFLVAICHQTSPQGVPPLLGTVNGQSRRGWDYLLNRFEQLV